MPNQPATETELLRAAYAAFNARDIDAALAGAVLADEHVGHRFTLEHGLIRRMEVGPLPSSGQ